MGIQRINLDLCNGCGECVNACPMDVIRYDEELKRPYLAYPQDCQSCFLCEIYCPLNAIYVTPWRTKKIPHPFYHDKFLK